MCDPLIQPLLPMSSCKLHNTRLNPYLSKLHRTEANGCDSSQFKHFMRTYSSTKISWIIPIWGLLENIWYFSGVILKRTMTMVKEKCVCRPCQLLLHILFSETFNISNAMVFYFNCAKVDVKGDKHSSVFLDTILLEGTIFLIQFL